ncbi:MAG: aspartate dehydrogenase [Candidatus Kapabacteria bacterium]|nr:aspartate dehydrogenase [Candidatus Kapabacteria bacterium]MCS7169815.1 aspartate dehydrogenase [Candidatus Kapabacteria bacterium]MDW7996979.1 aspartate dehydrogenase [Bacteroidota bacterium]MDW8225425.1 aspartate dehydrogenase [Bacteroidota bacterium]
MAAEIGVGLMGCGAIGFSVAEAFVRGEVPGGILRAVFDQNGVRAQAVGALVHPPVSVAVDVAEFLRTEGLRLVVEAASQQAVHEYGAQVLQAGCDLLILSVGALLEPPGSDLPALAERWGRRLHIPSGGIVGIDGLKAAAFRGEVEVVVLTTRKPPYALAPETLMERLHLQPSEIREPMVVYEGPAREAVRYFPANINVAATLSLAGIGPERTMVRIVADPRITLNVHEIYARGAFGEISITVRNITHPQNPRTSMLSVLSVLATLREICRPGIHLGT